MSVGLAREMGDESQAFLVPVFYDDLHVRCHQCIEYISSRTSHMGFTESRYLGVEKVEDEAARLVES